MGLGDADFDMTAYREGYQNGRGDTLAGYRQGRELGQPQPYEPGLIYGKLAAVMAELPAVGKDSVNQQQGWNFRGVDAVVNAISPALRKHGVVVVPQVVECSYRDTTTAGRDPRPTREVTVRVSYTFYAEDGSSVTATVPGESLDQSDKGSAKAMSVAFRIALLQVFALPTSEPDPDASYHTRDGGQSMTPTVATVTLDLLHGDSLDGVKDAWTIVKEHSATDRAIPGEVDPSGLTWYEATQKIMNGWIERIETWDQGKEVKATAEALGFHSLQGPLKARADFLAKRRREAFDASMQAITTATTLEGLEAATVAAGELLDKAILSEAQAVQLHTVAHERGEKIRREQNVAAPYGDPATPTEDQEQIAHEENSDAQA
jgi:hypothetical protein